MADKVVIVLPIGDDSDVSNALRGLTQGVDFAGLARGEAGGLFGGEFGYGVNYENDVFMMHRYCGCERDDCLWCGGCGCAAPYKPGRYLDGAPVAQEEYERWHQTIVKPSPREATNAKYGSTEYNRRAAEFDAYIKERDERSGLIWPSIVHHCGHQMFLDQPNEIWSVYRPRPYAETAPHFWHKPTGARVWWYKYIGRSQILHMPSGVDWLTIFRECHASIEKRSAGDARASQARPADR